MNAAVQSTTLAAMRTPNESHEISLGFANASSFELMQRAAKLLASSTLVPVAYRVWDEKKGKENPSALANCVVALNMAQRMGGDPLMVMQNLYIVEGRPSWSSQWIIAAINGCGRFSPLRFDMKDLGEKEVEYTVVEWVNQQKTTKKIKTTIRNMECIAWATEKETGERITSPAVSMEMAVKEGWYGKSGSKWQTMPEVMLRYRTASFFGKLYAPELLMGLQTQDEAADIIDISKQSDGTYAVNLDTLRAQVAEGASSADPETGEIIDGATQVNPASDAPAPAAIFDINAHELKTQAGIKAAAVALHALLETMAPDDRASVFMQSSGMQIVSAASRSGQGALKDKFVALGIKFPTEA